MASYYLLFFGLILSVQSQLNDELTSPASTTESTLAKNSMMNLALSPIENDLLGMNIKLGGENRYNIHELPNNDGQPVLVEVSVSLRNILEIDEHKQLVTLETTLRMYWRDPRLRVDHLLNNSSSDYILLHPETSKFIWFPDIYIDFAKFLRIPTLMIKPASIRVYRNSTVRYATQINYDVACPMDFRKYPYDTQTCKVKYESYGHTIEKMRVVWKKGFDQSKVTDNNYISLTQFEYAVFFEENYEEEIASGVYPGVIMTLLFRRKISYHLLQTYLPSGLFVIVAWLSLFLPPESIPGRITMAMTTLLTLAAMFGAVRQNVPRVSYVSALDIWMCTCIIFVFFALLEYVVVLCLINHCKYSHADNQAQPVQPKSRKHKYHWDGGGGNGMKCNSNPELIPMHSNSFHGNQHYQSPKPYIKRSRLFFCCSKKGAKNRHHRGGSNGQGHVVNARYEREHIFEDEYSSAPSTLARSNPQNCAICRSSEASISASAVAAAAAASSGSQAGHHANASLRHRSGNYASVGTSTRMDSLHHSQYSKSSKKSHPAPPAAAPQVPNKRPFQHVEKTCSFVMALLFLLFNAIYWPWLLRDEDFDYAKFTATQQQQIKL